ncbi:hypothetical protein [Stenotrophomonas sp.]|uniref:hypothetical protein n=1 Tax=Stenotrophomonas sp. TaxID=69392 RepID=UPI002FC6175E
MHDRRHRHVPLLGALLGLTPLLATAPLMAAPPVLTVALADGSGAHLRIDSAQGSAQLQSGAGTSVLRVNPTLRDALSRSDTVQAVGRHRVAAAPDNSVLLLVSAPSNPGSPSGYCGAGQEDGLMLLAVRNGALVVQDFVLLQSCVHSIEQAIDMGSDAAAALHPLPAPWLLRFAAMQDDRRVERCVGIKDERLNFQDDCMAATDASP